MLFEEFFKKKKISLDALQKGAPELFLEFKEHYSQMGEKSFDHTKKYWFNRLRHEYPLPPEIKAEKVILENQVAEQTIADALTEPTATEAKAPAKMGFKPKFKAAIPPQPEAQPAETPPQAQEAEVLTDIPAPQAKPAYKPRFQAKKPTAAQPDGDAAPESIAAPQTDNTLPQTTDEAPPTTTSEPTPVTESTTVPAPKLGFKPRFKTAAPVEQVIPNTPEPTIPLPATESTTAETQPQLGFKPRFKAQPVPKEEDTADTQSTVNSEEPASTEPAQETQPPMIEPERPIDEAPNAPKPTYKPRFTPKMIKPKPPEAD